MEVLDEILLNFIELRFQWRILKIIRGENDSIHFMYFIRKYRLFR